MHALWDCHSVDIFVTEFGEATRPEKNSHGFRRGVGGNGRFGIEVSPYLGLKETSFSQSVRFLQFQLQPKIRQAVFD